MPQINAAESDEVLNVLRMVVISKGRNVLADIESIKNINAKLALNQVRDVAILRLQRTLIYSLQTVILVDQRLNIILFLTNDSKF